MTAPKEFATVHTACEVSFKVGHMDYGTIAVPVGTKVFRHNVNGKVSDWFLTHDSMIRLCPDECIENDGKVSALYCHDATHYGITLPNANVKKDSGTPSEKHSAHHY